MSDHPITSAEWAKLSPMLDELLDAPPPAREALLDKIAAEDLRLRDTLQRLLAASQHALPLLDGNALERFDSLAGAGQDPPDLPDVLGGRYRIERALGQGGMASVYLAFDVKHGRNVAIKVIRPDLSAALGSDRFLREIAIVARLRHPNVTPLFDSGDVDGLLYYVMPYEAGQSLRDLLGRDGSLTIPHAISILRDIARALTYAHQQGVVHRDIKPDNVLLSGDAAVVTDFGIAKAFELASMEPASDTITQAGVVIGTPAYMSPEQGLGDPTADHRADIYSFGCLAYEVFTGTTPFPQASKFDVVAAQMATSPTPLEALRSGIPAPIAQVIDRCLERDPGDRPQDAAEILQVFSGSTSVVTSRAVRRRPILRAATGAALLGVLAVAWLARPTGGPVTVAVLPLLSRGGDSIQALVAEGFGEDLSAALGKVPWIRVVSRVGAFNYKGLGDIDPRATGKALGARFLVMGSMRTVEGRQTLLIQLISTEDDFQLWSDQFERPQDLEALRNRIVATISDSLRREAGGAAQAQATLHTHRGSAEAYNLYLIGKQKLRQRSQSIAGSIAMFREAVALDSLAADAYSGLSLALALSPYFQGVRPDSVYREATASARRAISLDPTLAEPHVALGLVLSHRFQWAAAESEFQEAIALDGHNVEARVQYGRLLVDQGRHRAALAQFQAARADDPASAVVASQLTQAWLLTGRLDSAAVEAERALRIDSLNLTTVVMTAKLMVAQGRFGEARTVISRGPPYWPEVLWTLAVSGDRETARTRIAFLAAEQPTRWMGHTEMAFGYLGLGDQTRALDELERATAAGEIWPRLGATFSWMFDPLRTSPRFRALLTRVGLPAGRG